MTVSEQIHNELIDMVLKHDYRTAIACGKLV